MYYMRQILNISLPAEMLKSIKLDMKDGGFASLSEFVRAALRAYQIETAWRRIQKSQREFAKGKGIRLKSFKDLR